MRLLEPVIDTGKKWYVMETVDEAESRMKFLDIRGHVQVGKRGIGWEKSHGFGPKSENDQKQSVQRS